ncbi:hypothetical protein EXIGLDRAFT_724582 [Exidia glandulosa HHB12029]|uniref:Uncharacterized protein n=1 Tax=Exidia glandulosa HHB12029 TaxID=1314781 RepID=A0A165MP50_EXIGL|nr:hypothetical protein EXIGLDRAFT_724582 [Exidia glandulosa HHB12029]
MARFDDLPPELADYIVRIAAGDHGSHSAWLAALTRISRRLGTVATRVLHEHIVVRTKRTCGRLSRACAHPQFAGTRTLLFTVPNEHVGSSAAVDRLTRAFEHVHGFGGPFGLFTRFVYTRPAFRPAVVTITTPCTQTSLVSTSLVNALAGQTTHLHLFLDPTQIGGGRLDLAAFGLRTTHVIIELPGATDGGTMARIARMWLDVPTLQRLVIRKGSLDMEVEWSHATEVLRDFAVLWNEQRVFVDGEPSFGPFQTPRPTLDVGVWGTGHFVQNVLHMSF